LFGLPAGLLDDLVLAAFGIGCHPVTLHPGDADQIVALPPSGGSEAVGLAFGFAENGERVSFRGLALTSRLDLRVFEHLFGRIPSITPQMLRVSPRLASLRLGFRHGLGPPAGSVGRRSLAQALRRLPRLFEDGADLAADSGELGAQVTVCELAEAACQTITLGLQRLDAAFQLGHGVVDLFWVVAAHGRAKAAGGQRAL
jgi:hypothetical protein